MLRTVPRTVPLALVLLLAALAPGLSAQGSLPGVEAQPVSSETDTFYVFGTLPPGDGKSNTCQVDIQAVAGSGPQGQFPYAVNNPNDPCATSETPNENDFYVTLTTTLGQSDSLVIPLVPAIPDNVQLRDGEGVSGTLRFAYAPYNAENLPLVFGGARPVLTLQSNGENLTTWDGAPEADPTAAGTPGTTSYYWSVDFEFDPVDIPAGPLFVIVSFTNDPAEQQMDMLAGKVELDVRPGNPGTIVVPFANAPETDDEDTGDGNTTTDGADGNGTTTPGANNTTSDGNQTVETPDDNTTMDPGNNSTAVDTEEGFLPGFEATALLIAGLVATLAVTRARGRREPGA